MERSLSKLRRALVVMFCTSAFLLLAFVVLYLLIPVVTGGGSFGANFTQDAQLFAQMFKVPFMSGIEPSVLGLGIALYVLSGLMFMLIVLGIVYSCSKHKGKFSFFAFFMLINFYFTAIYMLYFQSMLEVVKVISSAAGQGIYALAFLIVGGLAFISMIVTYILGLVYAKKLYNAALSQEEEDAKAIAEAAGDPEAVQEAEALEDDAAEPMIVESEPEPIEEAPAEEEVVEPIEEPIEEVKEEEPQPEVKEEPKEDKQHVEVNVNNNGQGNNGFDTASLASMLREVVRDIVRDEIARNNVNQPQPAQPAPNGNQTITGATFGGPLVVQYFNGGINGVSTPAPTVVENKTVEKVVEVRRDEPAPAPAPVEEPKAEEPAPAPVEEAKVEPAPAPAPEAAPRPLFVKKEEPAKPAEPVVEPKKYERISFAERLLKSESDVQSLYNEIKNEILSWGVKSRISAVGDTFRLHKKMYVRITVAGKSLKLYFALNPLDYANGTIPVQDASDKDMYQEIPLVFKVKSPLSVRRCKELIQDCMEKDGLEQGEVGKVNWIKELKAELAAEKKKEKEKE